MQTSVMECAEVFAVIDRREGLAQNGIIESVFASEPLAATYAAQKQQASVADEQWWDVLPMVVTSLLHLPSRLSLLFVVYESDRQGIRPVQLYAQESLAQWKVRELDVEEQIRVLTGELSGQTVSKKDYWWEVCSVIQ